MAEEKGKRKSVVALKFKPGEQTTPQVVAKGRGVVAEKIIEIAKENNILIHEDPDLVEVLSKLDIKQEIPPDLYKVVAEILLFVYKLNNRGKIQRK
jgi:flagellar biosynthesis protein